MIGSLTAHQVLFELGVVLGDINLNAIQTSVIPGRLRSRVIDAFTTISYGTRPRGAFLTGLLPTPPEDATSWWWLPSVV